MSTRYFDATNSFTYNALTEEETVLINSTQNAIFNSQYSTQARIAAFEAKQNTILTGDGDDVIADFAGESNTYDLRGGNDQLHLVDSNNTSIYAFGATGEKIVDGANSSTRVFFGDQLKYVGCWDFHSENTEIANLIVELKNPYEGDNTVSTLRFRDVTVNNAPQFIGNGFICSAEPAQGEISEPEEPPTLDDATTDRDPGLATGSQLVSPGTIIDTPKVTPTAESFF